MSTLTINWTLPTHRVKGGLLSPSEIESVVIEMSANNGTNWSQIGSYPPDTLLTQVFDVDPGVYLIRGTVKDKLVPQGVSLPLVADEAVVEDTSPPNQLGEITVTVG